MSASKAPSFCVVDEEMPQALQSTPNTRRKDEGSALWTREPELYHYGQVRTEKTLHAKWQSTQKYHSERPIDDQDIDFYKYFPRQFMAPYKETHPKVMADRIKKHPSFLGSFFSFVENHIDFG